MSILPVVVRNGIGILEWKLECSGATFTSGSMYCERSGIECARGCKAYIECYWIDAHDEVKAAHLLTWIMEYHDKYCPEHGTDPFPSGALRRE